PSNFLVDADCNVKLSDFGESRTLTKLEEVQQTTTRQMQHTRGIRDTTHRGSTRESNRGSGGGGGGWLAMDHKTQNPSMETTIDDTLESFASPTTTIAGYRDSEAPFTTTHMTVKGTVDYMAPEVIKGRGGVAYYDQAADVYSLAITMWDILNPGGDKFANQSHLNVFESVLSGDRPRLDPSLPPSLREVIQCAWQEEAQLRPTAQAIVSVLEDIQETLCATFVVDVMDELQIGLTGGPETSHSASSVNSQFSGAAAADVLLDHNFVGSLVEATRMGNAWMDAGLLHHARHARAFECNSGSLFFFDVDGNAKLRQAIETTARHSEPGGNGSIPMLAPASSRSQHSQHQHQQHFDPTGRRSNRLSRGLNLGTVGLRIMDACACQKLGQRLTEEKTARDKFRRKPFARRPAAEDLVLTTALLMDNDDDLDAFVGRGGSVASS
ncbi:hypothetical protein Gpo141_00014599, partial [Globisporangium polare]